MKPQQVIGWLLVAVLAVFIGFNLDPATIWFFGIRIAMPVALVVLFSAALGAGAVYALVRFKGRQRAGGGAAPSGSPECSPDCSPGGSQE